MEAYLFIQNPKIQCQSTCGCVDRSPKNKGDFVQKEQRFHIHNPKNGKIYLFNCENCKEGKV